MSNKKSNNDDAAITENRERTNVTKISDIPSGNDNHKHLPTEQQTSSTSSPTDAEYRVSDSDKLASLEISDKNDFSIDDKRVDQLKSVIGSGHFRINPSRVAEKFILFETQLSTS